MPFALTGGTSASALAAEAEEVPSLRGAEVDPR